MKKIILALTLSLFILQGCSPDVMNLPAYWASLYRNTETSGNTVADNFMDQDAADSYRSVLLNEDYGDEITYVIGHKHPDSDAVGSAIAYANLLNEIGIKAEAVTAGEMNNETKFALSYCGIEAPKILSNAADKQFVLVDHSTYTQALDGMEEARILGIVDHHGIGDVIAEEQINVRSAPVGATASLVFLSYRECNVPISMDMARAMLISLISDTSNGTKNMTEIDRVAYASLKDFAKIEDFDGFINDMSEASLSYEGMSDLEIFMSDYKEYEKGGITFGIGVINAGNEEEYLDLSGRMSKVMDENYDDIGLDMLFAMVKYKAKDCMIMTACGEGAKELLQECFHNYDGEKYFVFDKNESRKKDIVPALADRIEKM